MQNPNTGTYCKPYTRYIGNIVVTAWNGINGACADVRLVGCGAGMPVIGIGFSQWKLLDRAIHSAIKDARKRGYSHI
jgi:hypothetical protein